MKKRIFKAKRCERCFKTYLPSSGVQKYCPTCSAIVMTERKHYYNVHKNDINRKINEYMKRLEASKNEIKLEQLKPNKEKDVMKRIQIIMIIWLFANILTNIALTLIYVITLN